MLKSLDKLQHGMFQGADEDHASISSAFELSHAIQAEVNENYTLGKIPDEYWPVLESIENRVTPEKLAEIIDIAEQNDASKIIVLFEEKYKKDFDRLNDIIDECGSLNAYIDKYYLPRPLLDSQAKIEIDARLSELDYCAKHHLTYVDEETTRYAVRLHLLHRQRKLDGVE